jgi:hypothetical protein
MRIHIDVDCGGDPDDVCALGFLGAIESCGLGSLKSIRMVAAGRPSQDCSRSGEMVLQCGIGIKKLAQYQTIGVERDPPGRAALRPGKEKQSERDFRVFAQRHQHAHISRSGKRGGAPLSYRSTVPPVPV